MNLNLVFRLCVEERLLVQRKNANRRKSCTLRMQRPAAQGDNDSWNMDLMADQLFLGQRFRILTLVDKFSRESLALQTVQRLHGGDVVKVLEAVTAGGMPTTIGVDNGPEFVSKSLNWWA